MEIGLKVTGFVKNNYIKKAEAMLRPFLYNYFLLINNSKGGARIQPSFDDGIQIHVVSGYLLRKYQ